MKIGTYGPNGAYEFHTPEEDRFHHTYVIGQTGTGKSTLIRNLIAQDLADGHGLCLIDPHGDLSESVVLDIPYGRDDDLIYLKPAHLAESVPYNPLFGIKKDDRSKVAANTVGTFVAQFGEAAVGDRSQQVLRNSLLALLESPSPTLLAVSRLLTDPDFRIRIINKVTDPVCRAYWLNQFENYDDRKRDDVISPILNKLDALMSHIAIRHVLAQAERSVNFERIITEQKILIVNLADLGDGFGVLGSFIVSGLWAAARSVTEPVPFYLYMDEFQHFTTATMPQILSEARKFKLALTASHQFWGQAPDEIKEAVFGNVGTLIAFRTGAIDAKLVAIQFDKAERQLRDLKDHTAYIRPLPPSDTRLVDTCPPPKPIRKSPEKLIANSLDHFATKRQEVEEEIKRCFRS
jgi:hypothetical protein